jgi:hypothetical protein
MTVLYAGATTSGMCTSRILPYAFFRIDRVRRCPTLPVLRVGADAEQEKSFIATERLEVISVRERTDMLRSCVCCQRKTFERI